MTVGRIPSVEGGIQPTLLTTKGDIIVATGNATLVRQGVGADGTVLTANSAQADGVEWAAPGGGSMTSIATGTLSSTGVNITSIPSTYIDLVLYVTAIVNATDNRGLTLRFNSDTGGNYMRGNVTASTGAWAFNGNVATDTYIDGLVGMGTSNTRSLVKITIPNYAGTTNWKMALSEGLYSNKDTAAQVNFRMNQGAWKDTSAISTLNIVSQDGTNFSGGTYTLYGVK